MLILFGIIGYTYLGVREFPSIDPAQISVRTSYTGANADIIESQITEPLEKAINSIDGIRNITSSSNQGSSNITIEFNLDKNLEEAAKKIVKKMGDKGKYDSANQTKTLIVMQVLGNSKTFFDSQKQLQDTVGFFTDKTLPDAVINDNDLASYFLFVGSDGLMNEMIESQWQN